jgi:hypothetical protein
VELVPSVAARRDQPCILEDPQVLHDAEAGHGRQHRLELAQRLAIALAEPVEQPAPIRVGQRPEDGFHLLHAPATICDR